MAMHKSEKDALEASSIASINSASSLRRKSLHVQNASSPTLTENNDEAERLARRHEMNASITSIENKNKRRSLGLGFLGQMSPVEIKDRISECIKLNTENKINTKNAFSIEIIDFMTYMIKKQDSNMSNLQVASTCLDVSIKIYGFRVDGVHTEIMKMAGGTDKQEDESGTNDVNEHLSCGEESEINDSEKHRKKKKRKNKQKLFGTANSLKGTAEIMKPSLWIMENEDSQTTDTLYQVMLSNHVNSRYYLHSYNDVIVDTIERKTENTNTKVAIPEIEDFSELEMCPPLANFEFQGWSSDDEKEEDQDTGSKANNENGFQFNLDASLPSEDEVIHDELNYLDIQDEEQNADECVQAPKPMEKIVDLCKVVSNIDANKTSEYSFLQKSSNMHWAGPSHWRISNFRRLLGESKTVGACQQKPVKKRKNMEMCYDDSIKEAVVSKFVTSTVSKLNAVKTNWYEEKLTLPRDMHYNISNSTKLYLHKLISIRVEKEDRLNATHVSDVIQDYDYNNENDTSNYCPNLPNEDYEINEDIENGGTEAQMVFTGDNLVAVPKLTNKISIAYSTCAKRIDMRQLKKSIWRSLIVNNDNENINTENQKEETKIQENKCFSEIYKTLPSILTKTNIEALSFPISFVSLLHLANEKTLKIQSLSDMSDLIIEAN